jgi:heme-degrading monooxygenase HmoA
MFVVIFEVQPRADRWDDYLETAGLLRPDLERIDGFIDNERYRSERDERRILSLSTWRDEKAVVRWRAHGRHHLVGQHRGRSEIFDDYRLRVGEVTADTHPPDGASVTEMRFDETEVGAATAVTITQFGGAGEEVEPAGPLPELVEQERYESINRPGARLLLASWRTAGGATRGREPAARHRRVRVIREYGMRDRREAPQHFPDVA